MFIVPADKQLVNEGFQNNGMTVLGQPFYVRQNDGKRRQCIVAQCHCGAMFSATVKQFQKNQSCGCGNALVRPRRGTEHPLYVAGGRSAHPRLHSIWSNMKTRCSNPKTPCFVHYGGKGVAVCRDWADSFLAFRDWALANGYTDAMTIDRIDSGGNYEPSNCRWVSFAKNIAYRNRMRKGISTGHRPPVRRGDDSPRSKISSDTVRDILARRSAGATYGGLVREFGLSKSQISRICRRQSWNHIQPEAA